MTDTNVVDLTAKQPHINIYTHDGNVHVLPLAALRNVVKGVYPAASLGEEVLRAIVSDCLSQIEDCI